MKTIFGLFVSFIAGCLSLFVSHEWTDFETNGIY